MVTQFTGVKEKTAEEAQVGENIIGKKFRTMDQNDIHGTIEVSRQ